MRTKRKHNSTLGLKDFLAAFAGDRPVHEITATESGGTGPFIIIRYASPDGHEYAVIVNPLALGDHLSVDVFPFADGQAATGGMIAMSEGRRHELPATGTASYGFPSAGLVAVLVGEQGEVPVPGKLPYPPAYSMSCGCEWVCGPGGKSGPCSTGPHYPDDI